MVPLIWAAFAPVAELRQESEPFDLVHRGPPEAWREVRTPEVAESLDPGAQSNETTIGTAPDREGAAFATRSDDLPPARPAEPALAEPSVPETNEPQAAPEALLSREAKTLLAEAASPAVKVKTVPEVKKRRSATGANNNRSRVHASSITSGQKRDRQQPRDRSGWIDIMRNTGWLEPGPRR